MQTAATLQEFAEEITNEREDSERFGFLPDVWARNPSFSAPELCLLAYRSTFADEESPYGLWEDALSAKRLLSPGFGEVVRADAISKLKARGILWRPHNSQLPRGAGGVFARPVDELILPFDECTPMNSTLVYRGWFDGTMSCDAMGLLLFLLAGTGKGPHVYLREVEERFGVCTKTARKYLKELSSRDIVSEEKERKGGRISGSHYVVCADLEHHLPKPKETSERKKLGDRVLGDRLQGDRKVGDIRILPSTDVSPLRNTLDQDTSPPSPSLRSGEAPEWGRTPEVFSHTEVQRRGPERIILADWRACEALKGRKWCFSGQASPPLNLDEWCWWLDQFGGAPAQLRGRRAHQQATEIAYELRSTVDSVIWAGTAMVGLAHAISDAHRTGHAIHSLGFVAAPLLRRAEKGDLAWALDVPDIETEGFDAAVELATRLAGHLAGLTYGIKINRRELLSTCRVEDLRRMLAEHGEDGVTAGVKRVIERQGGPSEGHVITGWRWFAEDIAAAKAEATPPPPVQSLPRDPIAMIRNADGWKLIAPGLLSKGKWALDTWLEPRAREHGVEPVDILDELLGILSAVDETRYADKQAAVKAITAGSTSTARKWISQWHHFDPAIARAFAARQAA